MTKISDYHFYNVTIQLTDKEVKLIEDFSKQYAVGGFDVTLDYIIHFALRNNVTQQIGKLIDSYKQD
jgi:hypothetical protein